MKNFEHVDALSLSEAISLLEYPGQSLAIAGGTDLLTQMKSRIVSPERIVNLKTIPELNAIRPNDRDGLRIGALRTLSDLAHDQIIRSRYPALYQAIASAATRQIRNQGTIGGNLLQGPRCWYYRGRFNCWLKGGETCYARDGENSHHAIFSDGPCYMVHPSDMAPVLLALGASIETIGPNGRRTMPLEQMYQAPHEGDRRPVTLQPQEIICSIMVPALAGNTRGIYLKAMDRRAWAFALVSVALQISLEGDQVKDARMVLGGVAPRPYPVPQAAAALRGKRIDEGLINETVDLAVTGARPLQRNKYKVPLTREMVKKALRELIGLL